MQLNDENLEYAFSGTEFTNIGEDDSALFDTTNLKISFLGIYKAKDSNGANSIVLKLRVYNMRAVETWLCYSTLINNSEEFTDDFVELEPNNEQEICIYLEDYDIAYSNNHCVRIHFLLEDGRRRMLGRCYSLCVEYNIFSGRYQYKKIDKFSRGQRREFRELDIKVNKMNVRRFFASDWTYMYFHNTIPIIVVNHTDRQRAFVINTLEFDGEVPEEVIGIDDMTDAISICGWGTHEFNIVVPQDEYYWGEPRLFFDFTDISTDTRYVNAYTYNNDSKMCKIDYSLVFIHDSFRPKAPSKKK